MKLTPSKMLSSMALATVLVGAFGGAHSALAAAPATTTTPVGDFTPDTNGGLQVTDTKQDLASQDVLSAYGDIEINGYFNKAAVTLPTPEEEGHYLRVQMPIKMDFTYDVDTKAFIAANGAIINQSVKATDNNGVLTFEDKAVDAYLVGLEATSVNTTGLTPVFVSNTTTAASATELQLPLNLEFSGVSGTTKTVTMKNVEEEIDDKDYYEIGRIQPGASIGVAISQIQGSEFTNADQLPQGQSKVQYNMSMLFEYVK